MHTEYDTKYYENIDCSWSSDSKRLFNTPSETAQNLFLYIQEAGYFQTFQPYHTERRNLNSFLIIYTISGEGTLEYNDKSYLLTSGSSFFINCSQLHKYFCSSDSWEFLWIHFNGKSALGYYELFSSGGFDVVSVPDKSAFEQEIKEILKSIENKSIYDELSISYYLTGILTKILSLNGLLSASQKYYPNYIKSALKYISDRFTTQLTLEDIANASDVSKFHLSREFKKTIGININEYITIKRINYSKELLEYTRLSIEVIAFNSGFLAVSYYIKTFKKYEQKTPKQFRNSWKQ